MDAKNKPRYQVIAAELRERIFSGEINAHELLCTEKSLCETYQVSRITAKRAMELLEDDELIYRRRGAGSFVQESAKKSKWLNRTRTVPQNIALVIPFNFTKGGLFKTLESAADILTDAGYYFSLHVSHNEQETLASLQDMDMRALVYYPVSDIHAPLLDHYTNRNLPVIILDKSHDYPQYSSITCDNQAGQTMLVEHLVAYGHKKTAYLSRFTDNLPSIRERFHGYVNALDAVGKGYMPRFIRLEADALNHDVLRHIIITLRQEGITALLCENDEVAFYTFMCCRSLGLRIPEDMSITGFDNIEWAVAGEAQITTVDQNFLRIGSELAELLVASDYSPKRIRVPVTFVPRSSTGLPCSK